MSEALLNADHDKGQVQQVVVLGAGVIGLSSALWLQKAGHAVTLIDQDEPGLGTSFGNAGLFADYARLPFANFTLMCKMPKLLLDSQSPLSMKPGYLPQLVPYGWHYFKACFPANYRKGKQALTGLQNLAQSADRELLSLSGSESLVRSEGCLGLFSTQAGFEKAQSRDLKERRELGVELAFMSREEVQELEPNLNGFHAGGVFYPNTRHAVSPVELSRSLFRTFRNNGGQFIREKVTHLKAESTGVTLQTSLQQLCFDRLVIATGAASKSLVAQLGVNIPLVCERGYHLALKDTADTLTRPVGWLDQGIFLTPMAEGIRVAGTAEFAESDAPPSPQRAKVMQRHADTMLGRETQVKTSWVGSRPSTPDSLPVIGNLRSQPRVTLAFGHGHLGLTLASVTGSLVSQLVSGMTPELDLSPFAPERFG